MKTTFAARGGLQFVARFRLLVVVIAGFGPIDAAEPTRSVNGAPSGKLPEPTPSVAVLDLPDDGFLQGQLLPMAAGDGPLTTLRWRSPLFSKPLEFRLDAVERIRFQAPPAQPPAADVWRVDLRGGDFAVGMLDSIDANHVVLQAGGAGPGPLRIRRAAVERLARTNATMKVIVPGFLAGWECFRGGVREEAGRIVCDQLGTVAYRDVPAPPRACFEVGVAWDKRPEFELFFAAGPGFAKNAGQDGKSAKQDLYRIEALNSDLIAAREGATAAFDSVGSVADAAGSLRLRVFIDQDRGRMAVLSADPAATDRPLFDQTVPPGKPGVQAGFVLKLRRGGIRINSLRVMPWTDAEPKVATAGDLGGPDAVVESFDRAVGMFAVREGDAVRQVAAVDVSAVDFSTAATVTPPPAAVQAVFHGGTRLTGRILEVTDGVVRLDCQAVAEPLTCDRRQLALLEPLATAAAAVRGRLGLLEGSSGRMRGCLVNAAGNETGIAWQPRGGVEAVAIGPAEPLRISYDRAAGVASPTSTSPVKTTAAGGLATLYLKTGDSVQCSVLAADGEGVRIKTDMEADLRVPAVALRAVELLPSAAGALTKDKVARLLTLPRLQQADPPTHMLRLPNGDYLRGKLLSVDASSVRIEVLGTVKEFPRSDVARLIWLSIEGDDSEARAAQAILQVTDPRSVPSRATMLDGRRVSFAAERLDGKRLIGRNGVLGTTSVDLDQLDRLDLGRAALEPPQGTVPYSQWKLKPAAVPRALKDS